MSYRSKNWLEQKFHDANIKGLARNVYRAAVEAYEFAKSHGAQDRTEATILAAYHRTLFEIIVQMHRAQTELRRAIAEDERLLPAISEDDHYLYDDGFVCKTRGLEEIGDAINIAWYDPFPERETEIKTLAQWLRHVASRRFEPVNERKLADETGVTVRTFRLIVEGEVDPPEGFEGGLMLALNLTLAEWAELRDILHPREDGEIRCARFGDDWERAPDELLIPEGTDETT